MRPSQAPDHLSHEDYIAMQRRRVAELAGQILAGKLDVLDGSSKIFALQGEIEVDSDDPDFGAFIAVVSETDHLPVGAEALNWSEDALARKEPDVRRAQDWAISIVRHPCENLIARFTDA